MHWIADYWWVILIILAGMIINSIKEMMKVDPERFLKNKRKLPPHRDFNDKWDDEDDFPKKKETNQDEKK